METNYKSAFIMSNDLNRLIKATEIFVTESKTNTRSGYIRLDFCKDLSSVTAISVDGYRMSVEHSVISYCSQDFSVYIKKSVRFPRNKVVEITSDDSEVALRCDGFMIGFEQPDLKTFDYQNAIPSSDPIFKIAFNGNYLLSAIKAAKASCGNSFKDPVILEFRGKHQPVVIRTNKEDIKIVMPMRLRD